MKWDKEIESWGFTWIDDKLGERAVMKINGQEISIMAFDGDEYELAYIDANGEFQEQSVNSIEELRGCVKALMKEENEENEIQ